MSALASRARSDSSSLRRPNAMVDSWESPYASPATRVGRSKIEPVRRFLPTRPSMIPSRHSRALVSAALMLPVAATAFAQATTPPVHRSAHHDYRVVTVAEGLVQPWSMTFLPNGDMLVTEKPGRLRIVRNGKLLPNAVQGLPRMRAAGQGGLLDV